MPDTVRTLDYFLNAVSGAFRNGHGISAQELRDYVLTADSWLTERRIVKKTASNSGSLAFNNATDGLGSMAKCAFEIENLVPVGDSVELQYVLSADDGSSYVGTSTYRTSQTYGVSGAGTNYSTVTQGAAFIQNGLANSAESDVRGSLEEGDQLATGVYADASPRARRSATGERLRSMDTAGRPRTETTSGRSVVALTDGRSRRASSQHRGRYGSPEP